MCLLAQTCGLRLLFIIGQPFVVAFSNRHAVGESHCQQTDGAADFERELRCQNGWQRRHSVTEKTLQVGPNNNLRPVQALDNELLKTIEDTTNGVGPKQGSRPFASHPKNIKTPVF